MRMANLKLRLEVPCLFLAAFCSSLFVRDKYVIHTDELAGAGPLEGHGYGLLRVVCGPWHLCRLRHMQILLTGQLTLVTCIDAVSMQTAL